MGSNVPYLHKRERKNLKKISLKKLNQHISLFHFSADLEYYKDLIYDLKLHDFEPRYIGMWCQLCLFQNGMDFNSMVLTNNDDIEQYCKDVVKLWLLTVNNFRSSDCKSNLAHKSIVEKMLLKVEAMARFFAQVSFSCPAYLNFTFLYFIRKL